MKKCLVLAFLIVGHVIIIYLWSNVNSFENTYTPKAKDGTINLSEWNKKGLPIIKLDGEWDFYWQALPYSTNNLVTQSEQLQIKVPNPWNKEKINGEILERHGYGTYELELLFPEQLVGKTLALSIPSIGTSYKLWIDNKLITSVGTVAATSKEAVPAQYAQTIFFEPKEQKVNIAYETANYFHRTSGIWDSIELGTVENISFLRDKKNAKQLFTFGALLIMGIYNIFNYILRRRAVYPLYLGLLCLMFAIRSLLIGEIFLVRMFPSFPWELQMKLEYLPIVTGLPLLVKYVHSLYPDEQIRLLEKGTLLIALLFLTIVILLPADVYSNFLSMFLAVVLIGLGFIGYIFLKAYFANRVASLFTIITYSLLISSFLNDSLFFLGFIKSNAIIAEGFLAFLLSQSFVHAVKFSEANKQVEQLSEKLLDLNVSLEKKVEERTHELANLYQQLQKLYNKLYQSEQDRKLLISDISHELGRPLTLIKGYSEAIVDNKLSQEDKYVQLIYSNATMTEKLIKDLSELSRLETGEIAITFQEQNAQQYTEFVFQQSKLLTESQDRSCYWKNKQVWKKEIPKDAFLYIDGDRILQVFMNLLQNALNYTAKEKGICFEAEWKSIASNEAVMSLTNKVDAAPDLSESTNQHGVKIGESIIKVIDNGNGIDPEDIPFIFKRLYRGKNYKDKIKGRGLGLAISKEIVELHGGRIWVESSVGEGSTFFVSIPTYKKSYGG